MWRDRAHRNQPEICTTLGNSCCYQIQLIAEYEGKREDRKWHHFFLFWRRVLPGCHPETENKSFTGCTWYILIFISWAMKRSFVHRNPAMFLRGKSFFSHFTNQAYSEWGFGSKTCIYDITQRTLIHLQTKVRLPGQHQLSGTRPFSRLYSSCKPTGNKILWSNTSYWPCSMPEQGQE